MSDWQSFCSLFNNYWQEIERKVFLFELRIFSGENLVQSENLRTFGGQNYLLIKKFKEYEEISIFDCDGDSFRNSITGTDHCDGGE